MCHSMQELPYVESFVIDDTVMVVGSIQDLILCGQWDNCSLQDGRTGCVVTM